MRRELAQQRSLTRRAWSETRGAGRLATQCWLGGGRQAGL